MKSTQMAEIYRSWPIMLPWHTRVGIALLSGTIISTYLHTIIRHVNPSVMRLLLCAPIAAVNLCLPLLFDDSHELLTRATLAFTTSWLCTFKVGCATADVAMEPPVCFHGCIVLRLGVVCAADAKLRSWQQACTGAAIRVSDSI
jgi:hypothetical protein